MSVALGLDSAWLGSGEGTNLDLLQGGSEVQWEDLV